MAPIPPATPLTGVIVLDFTRYLSGPFTTMILRDLGARVVKLESPKGDPARNAGPFQNDDSAYFHAINRGKESVVVDFRSGDEVDRLRALMADVDCVVENFRPGVMQAMGLGPEACFEINPKLVFASCSGFGGDGPYSTHPAFDVVVQAMGGVMSVTGQPDSPPTRVGVSQGDMVAGVYTSLGILSALFRREQTGLGALVDCSMLEAQLSLMTHAIGIRVAKGEDPLRIGSRHPALAPFDVFPTSDGYVAIAVPTEGGFEALCGVLGLDSLPSDPMAANNAARLANISVLTEMLSARTAQMSSSRLVELLRDASVPVGPVLSPSDLLADPHISHRQSLGKIDDWGDDGLVVPGQPFRLDGERFMVEERGPKLGEMSLGELEADLNWNATGSADQGSHG